MKAKWLMATAVVALLLGGIGTAAAKKLLTGSDIRDRTLHGRDLARGTVARSNLTQAVQDALDRGTKQQTAQSQSPGSGGATGAKGEKGDTGAKGDAGAKGDKGDKGDHGDPARTAITEFPSKEGFDATNPSVKVARDGAFFGPYANGGQNGGSVCFSGLDGKTVSDVTELLYVARYRASNDTSGVGVPYLRIFTNDGTDHSIIFSPNTQAPDPDIQEGPFHLWAATSGTWRYDDDTGNAPDLTFEQIRSAHGAEKITDLCITVGFSAGQNLDALLRSWEINGENFVFGSGAGGGGVETPAP